MPQNTSSTPKPQSIRGPKSKPNMTHDMQLQMVSLPCHQHDQFHPQILDSTATTRTSQLSPCYIQEYTMTQPSGHNKHLGLLSLPTFITNITNIVTTHSPRSLLRSSKGSHTTDYRHTHKAWNRAKQPQGLHNDHRGNDQVDYKWEWKISYHASCSCMAENRSR